MHTPRAILPVASISPHGRISLKSGFRWLVPLLLASGFLCLACPGAMAGTMTCTYDDNGRLLSTDDGAGATQAFIYDQAGNITNVLSISPDNTLRIFISPQGTGTVAAEGIFCPGDCSHQYPGAPNLTLAPAGAPGYAFLGWGGDATGSVDPLALALTEDMEITAYFSAETNHTDTDGVADGVEMGPTGSDILYDGNGDGVPDYQQNNVASLLTTTADYVTLSVPQGLALAVVTSVPNPSPTDTPAGLVFPFGFFSFKVVGLEPGACTVATLDLPLTVALDSYTQYGPTPDNATPHWYTFTKSGSTGAQINDQSAITRVTIDLCDGQRGDSDLTANGAIDDPGGPTQPVLYAISTQCGPNGSISPTSANVAHGLTKSFSIIPALGYKHSRTTGCGGTLNVNTYTTGPITAECTIEAEFTLKVGSLRMDLLPQQAVAAGAKWRRTGTGVWLDCGHTETGISPLTHTVEFKDVDGWYKPGNMTVAVADSSEATVRKAFYSNEASLCKALDNCRLDWTFDGPSAWFGQDESYIFGRNAAQSGDIGDSQTSSIETTVRGPGNLSFYWKVSSEEDYDYLGFFIDDELQGTEISGEIDWTKKTYAVEEGTHILKWQYRKDSSSRDGSDCGWVDKVRWPNESELSPGTLNLLMQN